jgi:ribonuclease HI
VVKNTEQVIIYTDGGCDPNPGVGGWAAVMLYNGTERELSGGDPDTTNNRMELIAAVEALSALKRPCSVVLHTDSQYLKNGITQWLPGWKRKGWKRKGGELKNVDLWKQLDELAGRHAVEWRWVRGHAGNHFNERCDVLAGQAIAEQKRRRGRGTDRGR